MLLPSIHHVIHRVKLHPGNRLHLRACSIGNFLRPSQRLRSLSHLVDDSFKVFLAALGNFRAPSRHRIKCGFQCFTRLVRKSGSCRIKIAEGARQDFLPLTGARTTSVETPKVQSVGALSGQSIGPKGNNKRLKGVRFALQKSGLPGGGVGMSGDIANFGSLAHLPCERVCCGD